MSCHPARLLLLSYAPWTVQILWSVFLFLRGWLLRHITAPFEVMALFPSSPIFQSRPARWLPLCRKRTIDQIRATSQFQGDPVVRRFLKNSGKLFLSRITTTHNHSYLNWWKTSHQISQACHSDLLPTVPGIVQFYFSCSIQNLCINN